VITVIRHGSLIDGVTSEALPDAAVVVEHGLIREVGPSRGVVIRDQDTNVVDARGKTILPGFIDSHIHINIPRTAYSGESTELAITDRTSASAAVHAVHNARELVSHGITTIRDVGSHGHGIFAVKALIDAGRLPGPRIVACGRAIAMTGGHELFLSVEGDGPDEIRKLARTELKAGATALKFMASGAGAEAAESPFDVQLTPEELAAGVQEAKARGRTTCAHAVNPAAARNAILAGVDSIEHGVLLDDGSLALLREHGTYFVPTVWTYQMTADHGDRLGVAASLSAEVKRRVQVHLEVVAKAHALGIPICAGTDSALPVNPPQSLFWELEWLMHCGLSAMEAIKSATATNARLLGLADRIGTIEPGKVADLLLVDGDPLADIRALTHTQTVIQTGEVTVLDGRCTWQTTLTGDLSMPDGPFPPGFGRL
jgi:imidazolonepropionase-like amidohydrolase